MVDVRWERQLHQAGSASALAVAPDHLVVHERNTRLVSLDPADGSVRWDVPVGTWPRSLVVAGPRCLVIPQNTDRLLCLDLDTGAEVWSAGLRPFTGHVVVSGDTVLVGGWRGYAPLRALDVETGRLRWEADEHTVLPARTTEGFLTGAPGGTTVRLIDRGGGTPATWALPEPLAEPDDGRAFVPDPPDRFLVRCGRRTVVRIAPSTGAVEVLVRAEHDLAVTGVHRIGGVLWLAERGGGYTVVDAADGRLVWRVDPGRRLVPSVVPVGGAAVVADVNGTLLRVGSDGLVGVAVARRACALHDLGSGRVLVVTKGTLLALGLRNWCGEHLAPAPRLG